MKASCALQRRRHAGRSCDAPRHQPYAHRRTPERLGHLLPTGPRRWRVKPARSILAAMSASVILLIFTTGLFAGALLALGIAFLVRRERRGEETSATSRFAELLAPLRT